LCCLLLATSSAAFSLLLLPPVPIPCCTWIPVTCWSSAAAALTCMWHACCSCRWVYYFHCTFLESILYVPDNMTASLLYLLYWFLFCNVMFGGTFLSYYIPYLLLTLLLL
jgi:hypothetical protein